MAEKIRKYSENQLWCEAVEAFLIDIKASCKLKSSYHEEKARYYKNMKNLLGIPVISLPLIAGSLNEVFHEYDSTRYTVTFLLLISTIINGISQKVAIEKLVEQNVSSFRRYNDLVTDIEEILVRSPSARYPPTEVMKTIKGRYDNINNTAPL